MHPDIRKLYRLPWSMTDNPIAWVEVTDVCNLKCEGCYRLILSKHKPLKEIKEEIDFMVRWRNPDGVSLAGGEALLHPDIVEIVEYISSRGLKSIILTNGYALKPELIRKLWKAGLTGFSFHIDSTQWRPELKKKRVQNEAELNPLRRKYAQMVKEVSPRLYVHMGITVTPENLPQVPDYIRWCIHNLDVIDGISLIIFRGFPVVEGLSYYNNQGRRVEVTLQSLGYAVDEEGWRRAQIKSTDVYRTIKEAIPDYEATCYLNGSANHASIKWLIGNVIAAKDGTTFGAYTARSMELAQVLHHLFKGRYLVYPRVRLGRKVFGLALVDRGVRRALGRYLLWLLGNPRRLFTQVKAIGIGIVQAPDLLPDGRVDMCDSCPDMCVWEGKLVNSCRLDECRRFGSFLHAHVENQDVFERVRGSRVEANKAHSAEPWLYLEGDGRDSGGQNNRS